MWYGADTPKYRVSWTTGQTEKRFIKDRNVFSDSGLFLRTESGVFAVAKYPYDKDRWVLEKAVPVPSGYDVVDCNYSYEPLFIFKDKDGNFLPLERQAVVMLIFFHENPDVTKLTPEQMADMEKKIEAKEVMEFEDKLQDVMSDPYQIELVE